MPIFKCGVNEVIGSWNTMVSFEPRMRFSCGAGAPRISPPSKRTLPSAVALPASRPMAAMKVCVWPEPDWPRRATRWGGARASDTRRTAEMLRSGCEKLTVKSSMLSKDAKSALLHVEGVAQSVAEDIQGKQQHRQKSAGHEQYPGRRLHFSRAFGNQSPQARMGFLDAQSEETQEAFEHDDLRHGERGVDDDGSDDIGDHVFDDDAGGARPRRHRGLDELPPANAQGLTAHDARHGEPTHRADRQKQEIFAAAEDDGQEYDEEDQRQSAQDLDNSHHHMVGAPADVARNGAVADADEQTDGTRHQAHGQRDACALERARE